MKKAIITAIAIFGMSVIASAQSRITGQTVVHDGKDAIVTFNIETDDNSIPSNRKEIIMPYIYNGKDTVWLETVEVYGKNRYKREKQAGTSQKDRFIKEKSTAIAILLL